MHTVFKSDAFKPSEEMVIVLCDDCVSNLKPEHRKSK